MTETTLLWLRRDLRLSDHPALASAVSGGPVIPVFVLDPLVEGWGAAPLWRLGESLRDLSARLAGKGSRLVLRRGDALETLAALALETGARRVVWSRLYDAPSRARDEAVKAGLKARGLEARSVNGSLLFEPWTVETGSGGFYKVYTPFWRAVSQRAPAEPEAAPPRIPAPESWPASDGLDHWALGRRMNRGAGIVAKHASIGEAAAQGRLGAFLGGRVGDYADARDRLDLPATSGLSENLALGEISPRTVWHAGRAALEREGGPGPETFLKEIVWREFAYHLLFHTPRLTTRNWREEWDGFPWRGDNEDAEAWRRGMTGEPAIDAAMREMYVTGRMHNRARMLVASYLTKHLMTDWRVGEAWFRDCLIDWDVASNAMGWQWAAGSGPDAAPFFRVFNPAAQVEKFDPQGRYRERWIAELSRNPGEDAVEFFDAAPQAWGLSPQQAYPKPLIALSHGRERALAAYRALREAA
ncbi:cryptochrome/photolyase family protein [Rubrimonas cliftonensis]|uniref:Deoxyribodipyrimidine photo-lyase type I n=1 Tax=Rubrimonas cliftonensis TaxID=89524 RepID=A0A1H3VPT0_9RHOB|nr:deoxyribodipyrimidine photo-lyase [Rubrimonas cliftonensis]SDZ76786.1 deoxyribodipyrimidine photo-lyase type I [Rubrimonas cliftonensis]